MATCPFGGKTQYKTEHAAKRVRMSLERKGAQVKHMRIYSCPNCYHYHFTSRKD